MKCGKRKRLTTVGRRTGTDIKGKNIRILADGIENFDDYWTSSSSESGRSSRSSIYPLASSPSRFGAPRMSSFIKDQAINTDQIADVVVSPVKKNKKSDVKIPRVVSCLEINQLHKSPIQVSNKQNFFTKGRRTGADLLTGKNIRMKNGMENYNDYWSDTNSDYSSQSKCNKKSGYPIESNSNLNLKDMQFDENGRTDAELLAGEIIRMKSRIENYDSDTSSECSGQSWQRKKRGSPREFNLEDMQCDEHLKLHDYIRDQQKENLVRSESRNRKKSDLPLESTSDLIMKDIQYDGNLKNYSSVEQNVTKNKHSIQNQPRENLVRSQRRCSKKSDLHEKSIPELSLEEVQRNKNSRKSRIDAELLAGENTRIKNGEENISDNSTNTTFNLNRQSRPRKKSDLAVELISISNSEDIQSDKNLKLDYISPQQNVTKGNIQNPRKENILRSQSKYRKRSELHGESFSELSSEDVHCNENLKKDSIAQQNKIKGNIQNRSPKENVLKSQSKCRKRSNLHEESLSELSSEDEQSDENLNKNSTAKQNKIKDNIQNQPQKENVLKSRSKYRKRSELHEELLSELSSEDMQCDENLKNSTVQQNKTKNNIQNQRKENLVRSSIDNSTDTNFNHSRRSRRLTKSDFAVGLISESNLEDIQRDENLKLDYISLQQTVIKGNIEDSQKENVSRSPRKYRKRSNLHEKSIPELSFEEVQCDENLKKDSTPQQNKIKENIQNRSQEENVLKSQSKYRKRSNLREESIPELSSEDMQCDENLKKNSTVQQNITKNNIQNQRKENLVRSSEDNSADTNFNHSRQSRHRKKSDLAVRIISESDSEDIQRDKNLRLDYISPQQNVTNGNIQDSHKENVSRSPRKYRKRSNLHEKSIPELSFEDMQCDRNLKKDSTVQQNKIKDNIQNQQKENLVRSSEDNSTDTNFNHSRQSRCRKKSDLAVRIISESDSEDIQSDKNLRQDYISPQQNVTKGNIQDSRNENILRSQSKYSKRSDLHEKSIPELGSEDVDCNENLKKDSTAQQNKTKDVIQNQPKRESVLRSSCRKKGDLLMESTSELNLKDKRSNKNPKKDSSVQQGHVTKNNEHIQDRQTEGQVRRSQRVKVPPLDHWRGQYMHRKMQNGELVTVVEDGRPEDNMIIDRILKRLKTYQEKKSEEKKSNSKNKKKPKLLNNTVNWKEIQNNVSGTVVLNQYTQEEEQVYLHRPYDTLLWTVPPNQDPDEPSYSIAKSIKGVEDIISFGYIDIEASKRKESQYSPHDNITFSVIQGKVKFKVYKETIGLTEKDVITVPCCNEYSIHNVGKLNAILFYCTFKTPMFKYQYTGQSNEDE